MTRYEAALESSPHLLDQLKAAGQESLSLRNEVALARTLLGEVLSAMGRAHGATGQMQADALTLSSHLLSEVVHVVDRAAAIEAKRTDQKIDVARLGVLLATLRNDLRVSLDRAGMRGAVPFVDAAFERARWTGELTDDAVAEALEAPASYQVKFRAIDRIGDKPIESNEVGEPGELVAKAPVDPRVLEVKRLEAEIRAAEREAGGNGESGNGHAPS